ncbi:MAG: DUF2071 domain-containing protein [Puniceicoccaceae bacterium]|nr:MAG: DUF2071 domain-containing protein [Puniceicoccaceae bacterium]
MDARQSRDAEGPPAFSGTRIIRQSWSHLLLMHWPVPAPLVRPLLPEVLELDLFEGSAWIGLTPFTVGSVAPPIGPGWPALTSFHEINLRTFVRCRGRPGVWFFSLDASSLMAVWLARMLYHLPYYRARIERGRRGDSFRFVGERRHPRVPRVAIEIAWMAGRPSPAPRPGSRLWFLTERYRVFARERGWIYECELRHPRWKLREARLGTFECDLFEAAGLPLPEEPPLLHHAEEVPVDIGRIRRCAAIREPEPDFEADTVPTT